MRLTTRTRYAVRALAYLGSFYGKRNVTLREIAEHEGITEKYLEQIFYRLTRAGILRTRKGPGGGYELARSPSLIRLIEIMSAVGESAAPVFCVADDRIQCCPRDKGCPARPYWHKLKQIQENFLKRHTLADICAGAGRYG
ncbi:MAG: Rrf2 family transcriptional regulator [candidate division WOR-3 bacterium]